MSEPATGKDRPRMACPSKDCDDGLVREGDATFRCKTCNGLGQVLDVAAEAQRALRECERDNTALRDQLEEAQANARQASELAERRLELMGELGKASDVVVRQLSSGRSTRSSRARSRSTTSASSMRSTTRGGSMGTKLEQRTTALLNLYASWQNDPLSPEEEHKLFTVAMHTMNEHAKEHLSPSMRAMYPQLNEQETLSSLWDNNEIQFARFICELEGEGALDMATVERLAEAMDLSVEDVESLMDRAQSVFDASCAKLKADADEVRQLELDLNADYTAHAEAVSAALTPHNREVIRKLIENNYVEAEPEPHTWAERRVVPLEQMPSAQELARRAAVWAEIEATKRPDPSVTEIGAYDKLKEPT